MIEERIEEVNKANEEFYQAFESLDISRMDGIWAQKEWVSCIHPGWSIRLGWPSVRDSWVVIFNNVFSFKYLLLDPLKVSKVNTLFQILLVVVVLAGLYLGLPILDIMKDYLIFFVAITTIISGAGYLLRWFRE